MTRPWLPCNMNLAAEKEHVDMLNILVQSSRAMLLVTLLIAPSCLMGQQKEAPYALVELTNGFGVTKQFKAQEVKTGESFIDYELYHNGARLPLRVSPTTLVCIPVWDFSQAEKTDGGNVRVSLTSGGTVVGTPFGSWLSDDGQSNGLASLQRLRVVKVDEHYKDYMTSGVDRDQMEKSPITYELTATDKGTVRLDVRNPYFVMFFMSSAGHVIGSAEHSSTTRSVSLKRGTDDLEAPILDFASITLTRAGTGQERVSVTTAGGIVTEGALSIKGEDSAGVHPTGKWWVGGILQLQGTNHTKVLSSSPLVALRRKN
jgi:hypothetical protein